MSREGRGDEVRGVGWLCGVGGGVGSGGEGHNDDITMCPLTEYNYHDHYLSISSIDRFLTIAEARGCDAHPCPGVGGGGGGAGGGDEGGRAHERAGEGRWSVNVILYGCSIIHSKCVGGEEGAGGGDEGGRAHERAGESGWLP